MIDAHFPQREGGKTLHLALGGQQRGKMRDAARNTPHYSVTRALEEAVCWP